MDGANTILPRGARHFTKSGQAWQLRSCWLRTFGTGQVTLGQSVSPTSSYIRYGVVLQILVQGSNFCLPMCTPLSVFPIFFPAVVRKSTHCQKWQSIMTLCFYLLFYVFYRF